MKLRPKDIPKDFPVRPFWKNKNAKDPVTCGCCGLSWDDAIGTSMTPAPSARCPFESFHKEDEETDSDEVKGIKIAEFLGLRLNQDGRYDTTWGTKTAKGLYLTLKRFMEEIE